MAYPMPNQLAQETSPYLLQHAENPVDWHPWGTEALDKARREDKPIFLSIGYSACHWCHVMAHESFEDRPLARLLNDRFVPIKVDREERPDLDQLYMESVQMLVGHGGWPLSVFLTPALEPFFGGTYWPPRPRGGMPGFGQILQAVIDAWDNRREELQRQAGELARLLQDSDRLQATSGDASLGSQLLDGAEKGLARAFDPVHGGFGPAPKFPHATDLRLLLRRYARTGRKQSLGMAQHTLDRMAAGGIYDHLGGGFHRYSTDAEWLVPHFEKMLYDNALLVGCYLEAWQITRNEAYAEVVRQTADYVLRDMTDPAGGFYSSEDADSEGHEGLFYLWTPDQVRAVLGSTAGNAFAKVYDVSEPGNFEGRNILHLSKSVVECARLLGRDPAELNGELADSRRKLLAARDHRARPGRDDKVLAGWNGLMIESLSRAGAALAEEGYLDAATRAASFLLDRMRDADGRLLRSWRQGRARFPAYLEDYAALSDALVSLYEASFEERWIDEAIGLADAILARFLDRDRGGFFFTALDQESVLTRKKDALDNATPGGGSLAITALVRLGKLCGRSDYLEAAESGLRAAAPLMAQAPSAAGQSLLALDTLLGPSPELVLLGDGEEQVTGRAIRRLQRVYVPGRVTACRRQAAASGLSPTLSAIFAEKQAEPSGPTLFVCQDFACQPPVSGPAVLESLERLAAVPNPSQSTG